MIIEANDSIIDICMLSRLSFCTPYVLCTRVSHGVDDEADVLKYSVSKNICLLTYNFYN